MNGKIIFTITALASIALFVGGFFVPPMGVIDGSLLKAGGILLGFGSVGQLPALVAAGADFKLQHGQTSLTVNTEGKEETEE